ncbi:MAG: 16S rRNA (guanine(966)-N(2))-methyltransferase RsmD [Candidatus Omnitrophota bacterium]
MTRMHDLRIIGGQFRGRKIKHPETVTVRPTKDRIREAVFNMIAEHVPGASVLDLFAGSGAFGLESLSRGAERVVFVEQDSSCSSVLAGNISSLEVEAQTAIIRKDAFKSIELLNEDKEGFDLIFSDPPYNMGMAKKTLIMINHYDILNPSGLLIIEHHRREEISDLSGNVSLCKQKTYKDISISVFRKK